MNKYDAKVFKNEDGLYRVKIYGYMDISGQGRWLMDSDLMTLMASSHKSKELTFGSISSAHQAIATFFRLRENTPILRGSSVEIKEPQFSDTWTELDPQPKLTSKSLKDGSYSFENIDQLFAWAKRKLSGK